MRKKILGFCLLLLLISTAKTYADDCANYTAGSVEKVNCYQNKLNQNQGQQKTLLSTIAYYDNKMALTIAQIAKTEAELKTLEEDIATLTVKISRLDENLTTISKLLISRVGAGYKRSLFNPVLMLFSSDGLTSFMQKAKYLELAQQNDKNLLTELQNAKNQHEQQKQIEEEKRKQAEVLKQTLATQNATLLTQKQSKQQLLEVTKNDEKTYQSLLAAARAEMAAIQSILAGGGKEEKIGSVNEGDKIASIISGSSACSSGTHLHFQVADNGVNQNPANFLKSQDVNWDLCGWWPDCDGSFSFTGSWNWPINGKPRITQGYGMTAYAKTGAYSGGPHTGLDMVSDDLVVKAVKTGTLYKGAIGCGGGVLSYVKVDHQGSNIATYYLHVYH